MNLTPSQIVKKYQTKIENCKQSEELEQIRIELLGRRGLIRGMFLQINTIPIKKRGLFGQELNKAKNTLEALIEERFKKLKKKPTIFEKNTDDTKVYKLQKFGHLHPITLTENEINRLFRQMGFSIYDGPEIDTDEYVFEKLNLPKDHPARDLQDTIFIQEPDILLRSQTSSVESHAIENEKPPFRVAFPGRVYRNEKVSKTNHFLFHQYQAVAVDKNICMKDLFGVLDVLFNHLYHGSIKHRYRCKYYPEVEPGVGIDIECFGCLGKGCPLCKGAGWIEMGGAGIIHPQALMSGKIDPKKWRGFAFGLGLDRWVMARYNIKDIRTLLGGNLAYLPNKK
jgi:phenylalanyl-tRNA synthetase alpha chain